ncbi:MAG: lamin tail domain-containing protein [Bacteroidales bacterium]|nr:lamin tail domain-containing protein [Bacteroidales bacterium]
MKKLFVFALAAVAALVACNPDPEADPNETKDVPSWPAEDATTVCLNEVNGTLKGIEIYNPTDAEVSLAGWTIVKNNESPAYWEGVTEDKIPAKGFMVIQTSKPSADLVALPILFATNKGTGGLSGKKALKLELKDATGKTVDFFDRGFTKAGNTEPALDDLGVNSAARVEDGKAPWRVKVPSYGASNNLAEDLGEVTVDPV